MDFEPSAEQTQIRDAVLRLCARFVDEYWLKHDQSGAFPEEFHRAVAEAGWLGIAMPREYGGAGLGIAEAAVMMQAIAESGAAMSGASAIHMNIFGLNPVVVFGADEQKRRMLPPLIRGEHKACFAVTEPDAGLDTLNLKTKAEKRGDAYFVTGQKIWISTAQVAHKALILARTAPRGQAGGTGGLTLFYADLDRKHVEIRPIRKMGRHAVDSNMRFFDAMPVPETDRIGAEGEG
ncbi:MAG: acyl-CoA dehydrogenase family protein, partial [Rhodospirillales bacterium]